MIRLKIYDPEFGVSFITRESAEVAYNRFKELHEKYNAQLTEINGDKEEIRKFFILAFDDWRHIIGERMANFFIRNVDTVISRSFPNL